MKSVETKFDDIKTLKDFFTSLKKQIALPAHFGDNLDALYDFLTTDLVGQMLLTWPSYAADAKRNDAIQAIGEALYRASLENRNIKIDLAPPKKKKL